MDPLDVTSRADGVLPAQWIHQAIGAGVVETAWGSASAAAGPRAQTEAA